MLSHRVATEDDLPALRAVMAAAIERLQDGFLDPAQVAASHAVMGLDTQLIADRSYFLIKADGRIAGCGGWSRRATLFGGDDSIVRRDAALLDPARDAARIRAMYVHPDFARRGIGRRVLDLCEEAARSHGFARADLMATLAGEPLYAACGYREIARIEADVDGVKVPLVRMGKSLSLEGRGRGPAQPGGRGWSQDGAAASFPETTLSPLADASRPLPSREREV